MARDVTEEIERKEQLASMQEALRQSQKMEAVGQLTGGLAHEPTVRMLIADVLKDDGYEVVEAHDGRSGLAALRIGRVDLLIADVGLPGGMNGRQLADAVWVWRPGLKVLFITGYADQAAGG